MSDRLNECAKCDNYMNVHMVMQDKRSWVVCDVCKHSTRKRRFKWLARNEWNAERSERQKEWMRRVEEVFRDDYLGSSDDTCPTCGGNGPGIWLALGFPVCMTCQGSGKVKK